MSSTPSLSILIMAGGRSRRMKRDKRLISLHDDQHLLGTVLEAVFPLQRPVFLASSCDDAARPYLPGVAVLWDRVAHQGPLQALVDACPAMGGEILALATDLPFVETRFLRSLLSVAYQHPDPDAVVPEHEGRLQPLCALYREGIWGSLRAKLESGEESLVRALESLAPEQVERWPVEREPSLENWNHPQDRRAQPRAF